MKGYVKKRTAVLLVSYLSAAAVCLGIFAGVYYDRQRAYERSVQANYQHAFGELTTALSGLDTALQKSLYATSPAMVSAVCTEVFGEAMTAQMALGVLPFSTTELEKTAGFISRVGDYAFCMAKSAARGAQYTDEERENLRGLSNAAEVLAANMRALQTDMQDGVLTMDEQERAQDRMDELERDALPTTLGESMRLIEKEFPQTPGLIYDGPFSEHIVRDEPKLLQGLARVSQDEARQAAASFTEVSPGRLYPSGEREGDLPCWYFSADAGGGTLSVAVSKAGGKIVGMLHSRQPEETRLDAQEVQQIAIRFLESKGYENMAVTYFIRQGNVATVNFAYKQGTVLCYSDLIKVSVACDTGAVCGFEAKGYLMTHSERALPEVTVSEEEARERVAPGLKELARQTVLVPSDGQRELLCHEFKCSAEDGRHYLIYVNAQTGEQEKILILLEDESGALTI